MTNAEFSQKDKPFMRACALVGIKMTSRQASKYRRKTGAVYKIVKLNDTTVHIPKEAQL